jgi:hypothetical protein
MTRLGPAAVGIFLGVYAIVETQWCLMKWVAGKCCRNRIGQRKTEVECHDTDFNRCVPSSTRSRVEPLLPLGTMRSSVTSSGRRRRVRQQLTQRRAQLAGVPQGLCHLLVGHDGLVAVRHYMRAVLLVHSS